MGFCFEPLGLLAPLAYKETFSGCVFMLVIPALRKQRQEHGKFQASQAYIAVSKAAASNNKEALSVWILYSGAQASAYQLFSAGPGVVLRLELFIFFFCLTLLK